MRAFYNKALQDPNIGAFFTKIAKIDLEAHIPHITDFWEQQLFRTGGYTKNVMKIHQDLHHQKAMEKTHFDTWLSLFHQTVDDHFAGEKAHLIKTRALSIATMMRIKIS
ncbi:group III truncated hemoglobin [Aquimarina sp. MMG016]|nr:group III truncated hemoglobin [Aquimarina sp. MMG016]